MQLPDLLPNRLNFAAIVFCGCTMKELQLIAVGSLSGCLLLFGLLTKCLVGMVLIGVGLGFPAAVGLTWLIALGVQKAKQGKPKGYLKQAFLIKLEDLGLHTSPFIRRNGRWSIGRRIG